MHSQSSRTQFLRVKDVADILDCNLSHIYNAINSGELPAYRDNKSDGSPGDRLPWRIKKKDFKEWLQRSEAARQNEWQGRRALLKLRRAVQGIVDSDERWLNAVDHLSDRVRHVLSRRYGLDGEHPATLLELSEELGVSRERVRLLQREAERQIKDEIFEGGKEDGDVNTRR